MSDRTLAAFWSPKSFGSSTVSMEDGPADRTVLEIHSEGVAAVGQSLTINHLAGHGVVF